MAYSRPPISEAVLDIQVDGVTVPAEELRALESERTDIRRMAHQHIDVKVDADAESAPVASRVVTPLGWQFWSADKTRVWQARTNGMAVSHLKPYQSWAVLKEESMRRWGAYRSLTNPQIKRLGLRYINRFDIACASGRINWAHYFRTVPEIPTELDTGLAGYLMQLILPQTDLDCVALVNQTPLRPLSPGIASLVVDIDLYRDVKVPQDEASIWSLFDSMRERKNFIFEQSLKQTARELIL